MSKKLVGDETIRETLSPVETEMNSALIPGVGAYPTPVNLQEGQPVIVDVEDFQYTYKCKHCGHEWSEKHEEEREFKSE